MCGGSLAGEAGDMRVVATEWESFLNCRHPTGYRRSKMIIEENKKIRREFQKKVAKATICQTGMITNLFLRIPLLRQIPTAPDAI